jgi:hypothetical protein
MMYDVPLVPILYVIVMPVRTLEQLDPPAVGVVTVMLVELDEQSPFKQSVAA